MRALPPILAALVCVLVLAATGLAAAAAPSRSAAAGAHGRARPLRATPSLGPDVRVFPVYGPASYVDTFGAYRSDVSGRFHHGDDIFAPRGTPVLACASGIVFSVGWNRLGGRRLWLRDSRGNDFYYAHLSGYSPFAVDGAEVHAGDVLGFVGDSGDAEGTPPHLHFEVHPAGLLALGYEGAVDPTRYLDRWRRLRTVPVSAGAAWIRRAPAGARAPAPAVPRAGALLLEATDISAASGLDPGALERRLSPPSSRRSRRGR